MKRLIGAVALGLALVVGGATAQQAPPVALVADQVTYDRETGLLTASGNVEVLYEGRVLRASRLTYDERAEEIRAAGPLVLVDPEGGVLLADAAALTPDLADGLIEGARVLISGQLQLAAVEARRSGGRFVTLDRVIASTCTICAGDPTPIWAIRAARVTQDPITERIYFENARIEVFGLPIAYVPRLSIPDPRVERASGFLAPEFLSSGIYGGGFKLPYYRVLGPSADATVTPFVTSRGGLLMEGEYRRRLAEGGFDVGGVLALNDGLDDDLAQDAPRWAFSAAGDFVLPRDFVLDFDASAVSDNVFLKQFDYSDADLLTSVIRVRRTRAKDDFSLAAIAFQSLLPDDNSGAVPAILPDLAYRRQLEDSLAGGRVSIDLAGLGVARDAGDSMFRATGGARWRRDWTLARGLRLGAGAGAALDAYRVWQNEDFPDGQFNRFTPDATIELRWPLVRRDPSADQVIEPIVQLIWSDSLGDTDVPNEDSTLPEFSSTNLFSLNRFPGRDRLETGLRANLGLQYARYDPDGWSLGLTFGRVLRATELDQFPQGAGLDGRWSDYVGAVTLDFDWGLGLANRLLVDSDLDFSRNEFSVVYEGPTGGLGASYIYLAEDATNPALGPQPETSEFALRARYRIHPNWEVRGNWRFDAVNGANLRAGAGVTYGNECAEIDLSVSRRYTSSDNLPPATTIGFGLRLAGFGASQTRDWPTRTCAVAGLR
ncbi:MAG: LPS-assembly protein LptD [Rhodobacteraceae bacterium]|nr:LPS-assembly protein LptD [Paracoccaceae bacterium]